MFKELTWIHRCAGLCIVIDESWVLELEANEIVEISVGTTVEKLGEQQVGVTKLVVGIDKLDLVLLLHTSQKRYILLLLLPISRGLFSKGACSSMQENLVNMTRQSSCTVKECT